MWEVKNRTPFQAAGAFERDKDGLECWCVAVRATFDISAPPAVALATEQAEVRLAPEYADEACEELLSEPDIAGFAPATDVLVYGTIKPADRTQLQIPLRLSVGKRTKTARLFGPRTAKRVMLGWRIETEEPVQDTRLSWRHSFGGMLAREDAFGHAANPIGTGVELLSGSKTPRGTIIDLPRIEAETSEAIDNPDRAQPIGFGPVPRHWAPRVELAGTYDADWESTRAPRLPADFDPRFYNTAPEDQQISKHLRGGELLALEGFLTVGSMSFRLPQVVLTAQTLFRQKPIETRFTLSRVEVDIDTQQLSMVWTTQVSCNGDDAAIKSSIVRLKQMSGVTT